MNIYGFCLAPLMRTGILLQPIVITLLLANTKEPCSKCKGSGDCPGCHGTGEQDGERCIKCRGIKKCLFCHGTGEER